MPTTYTVTGRWPFPVDMLRYDEAVGATPMDQALINVFSNPENSPYEPHTKNREVTITLVSPRLKFFLADHSSRRWESYGWRSSLDDRKDQHPKAPVDLSVRLPADEAAALALLCAGLSLPLIARAGLNVPQCEKALSATVRVRHALAMSETQKQMQEPGHG